MTYTCFVCGFSGLIEPFYINGQFSASFEICPCCGFQYGYHDLNGTGEYPDSFKEMDIVRAYRNQWITSGMKWGWSAKYGKTIEDLTGKLDDKKPKNWSPEDQIKNIPEEWK